MRNPFAPQHPHVMSRAWDFYVNSLAGSQYMPMHRRIAIYRRYGLDIETHRIYARCYFHTANIHIGPRTILNYGVHIENVARVEIGTESGLGLYSVVLTSNHDIGPHHARGGRWRREPVTIGDGCWIGARTVILGGVTIGDGCVVAAGSLVRKDCEPDGVYAGVPARRIKDLPPEP